MNLKVMNGKPTTARADVRPALQRRGLVLAITLFGASSSALAAHGYFNASAPALALRAAAQDEQILAPTKYVLAGASGAAIRNLADSKSHEVLRVKGDTPLGVYPYSEGSGYLKVAVPGGLKVWVFGKYLTESSRPGWLEVSGSYVNMRPRPQSSDSFPFGQLDRGERLRFIQRQDPSKPMSEDWVQVYSPPDTFGYVLAAETRALPTGTNPKVLWEDAVQQALNSQPNLAVPKGGSSSSAPIEAAAPGGAASQAPTQNGPGVFTSLAKANSEMDSALEGESPDYAKLIANYQAVLAMGPDAPTRKLIEDRLETLNMAREIGQIRSDIARQNALRDQQLDDLREQVDQGRRGNDMLWGRFQVRGWLEQELHNGANVYVVHWGTEKLATLQCSSGRYDLALYEGAEIGVKGLPVRAAAGTSGAYPTLDVDSIEVISVRMRDR